MIAAVESIVVLVILATIVAMLVARVWLNTLVEVRRNRNLRGRS